MSANKYIQKRDNIPPSLAEHNRFFIKNGYRKTDTPKGWNESKNWLPLEDIPSDKYFGMALTNTNLALIDGDHIIDASTGKVIPEARTVLKRIFQYGDSYSEYSMSGTGIHIIIDTGDYADDFPTISNGNSQIILPTMTLSEYEALSDDKKCEVPKFEIFYHVGGRYVALTGNCTKVCEVAKNEIAAAMLRECLKMVKECHDPESSESSCKSKFELSEEDKQRVMDALPYIKPDNRETWIRVGMSLYNCGFPFEVWDEWSKQSEKYNDGKDETTRKKWEGFKRNSHNWNIGTILRLAKECGWQEYKASREKVDKSGSEVKGKTPLIVRRMSEIEVKKTDFLYPMMFPRKLCILSAYPGSGKTNLACKLVASVSTGAPFFYLEPEIESPQNVIYFSSEDGYEDTIKPRLIKCAANMDYISAVDFDDDYDFDFADARLEELIRELRPALIVFDTLQNFIGNVNMNAANETTRKMRPLVRLADTYNVCILCVCHFNKNENGSAITRTIGSTDITGKCRSYMTIGNVPDSDIKFLSHEKSNVGAIADTILFSINDYGIRAEGTSKLHADDYAIQRRSKSGKAPDVINEIKEYIVRNMPEGKRKASEMLTLLTANGFSETTVKRAKQELDIKSVREGYGDSGSWFWVLPDEFDRLDPYDYSKEIGEIPFDDPEENSS